MSFGHSAGCVPRQWKSFRVCSSRAAENTPGCLLYWSNSFNLLSLANFGHLPQCNVSSLCWSFPSHSIDSPWYPHECRKLRSSEPSQLLILLCFGYLGIYIMFIISFYATVTPALCVLSGAILHYFMLATFILMAAEAINLFLKLVIVFSTVEFYVAKAAIIAWSK